MAVKLDILFNYIFDNAKLKQSMAKLNKDMISAWSPYTKENILNMGQRGNLNEYFKRLNITSRQFNDILGNTISRIRTLNRGGFFSDYLKSIYGGELPTYELFGGKNAKKGKKKLPKEERLLAERKNLNEKEIKDLAYQLAFGQVSEIANASKIERKNQEEEAKNIQQQRKLDLKRNIQHSRALEENKKRDEALRKKQWMFMLGKWGKFGVFGLLGQQAIKYLFKGLRLMYSTSQQGLAWQRTISGGASGGSWFGQDVAAYQRAGIDANKVQNFKRGLQGYIGSVKLGMGNAAPLMYLGLSALGDPDQLEKDMEKSLRRLPKDVSYALASQMGLDYDMWESIYTGKIDKTRQKPGYSEDAIKKWSEVADKFNNLLTDLKVLLFNKSADFLSNPKNFWDKLGWGTGAAILPGLNIMNMIPGMISSMYPNMFKFADINVIIKNDKGDVIGTGKTQIEDTMKEIPQASGE